MGRVYPESHYEYMRQYSKERVEYLKKYKICIDCGKEPAMIGRVRCPECLDKVKERAEETRSEQSKEQKRLHVREKYKWCEENGICVECFKRKATVGKSCIECYAKRRNRRGISKYDLWTYTEKCLLCGGERIPGKKVCEKCYQRVRKNLVHKGSDNSNHIWRTYQRVEIEKIRYNRMNI